VVALPEHAGERESSAVAGRAEFDYDEFHLIKKRD
jgi:hypothetical protein